MDSCIDFGELSNDENFKRKILDLRSDVDNAYEMIETLLSKFKYEELSPEDKVRYDLYIAFAINSFYWIYLRLIGIDPSQTDLKPQINRVRDYMTKSTKIYERKTIRPRLDQDAAKRFVRSGLWMPGNAKQQESEPSEEEPPVKAQKRKLGDLDD